MNKLETLAITIACSNFAELYYSAKSNRLIGCIEGRSPLYGRVLGALSLQEFCKLLLILNKRNWQVSEEEENGYVILTK